MNLLPFVFTFLLLLTLLTSFMFSSAIRITREKEIVLAEREAYLTLLSKQNKDRFDKKRPPQKKQERGPQKKSRDRQKKFADKNHQDFRDVRMGYEGSKVNLWPMIHGDNPRLKSALQKTVTHLIEILYSPYSFYKTSSKKEIARAIVQAMIDQKIESFDKLHLSDPELDCVYYTLIKGTNTGYPPLTEYCCLNNASTPPIHFRFTSKPVIRAVLGESLAQQLFDLEKKNHAVNSKRHALTKKEFLEFVQTHPSSEFDYNLVTELFYFKNEEKGVPQLSLKKGVKIRAFHEAKTDSKQSH